MRRLPLILLALLLASCSRQPKDDPHAAIRQEAADACQRLEKGDVDAFLKSVRDWERMSPDYQRQTRELLLQYLQHEQEARGGIGSLRLAGDSLLDSLRADVFVEVTYGDSSRETVALPLTLTPDGWRLY